jgi:hypothetical protein
VIFLTVCLGQLRGTVIAQPSCRDSDCPALSS